jgi:hypothetical protein
MAEKLMMVAAEPNTSKNLFASLEFGKITNLLKY